MTVAVAVFNAHPRRRMRRADAVRAVRRVVKGERHNAATVNVVFIDDRECERINRKYLGRRGSTDVISFPLGEGTAIEGEVYVNLDRAKKQAGEYGVSWGNEVLRLVIHGTLHLLGYDDRTKPLQRRMKLREERNVETLTATGRQVRNA